MKSEKLLWTLFVIISLLMFGRVISMYQGYDLQNKNSFLALLLILPFIVYCIHSITVLTAKKAFIFFVIAASVGLFFEYIGVTYGGFFGGIYSYSDRFFKILGVPFVIPGFWPVFAYMGFTIVDSFFVWVGKKTPIINHKNIWLLLPICIADGLIAMSLDLLMDPFQVRSGFWHWKNGGPYFNVPIGNFVGWIIVIALTTLIFRSYEIINPVRNRNISKKIYLVIVFAYAVFCLFYMAIAPKLGMSSITLIGLIPLTVVSANLYFYRRF